MKICLHCRQSFVPIRQDALYCSFHCAQKALQGEDCEVEQLQFDLLRKEKFVPLFEPEGNHIK